MNRKNFWKLSGMLSVILFCFGLAWMQGNVCIGTPVSDDVATTLRGGCASGRDDVSCPGDNTTACPSSTYVTGGSDKGTYAGSCNCSSSCGSYYKRLDGCDE